MLMLPGLLACSEPQTSPAPPVPATPVQVVPVKRTALELTVIAPGRTDAIQQEKVRAPFKGKLVALRVADGDRVRAGQDVAEIISQESESAVTGAQAMVAQARTPQARADATDALQMARKGRVVARLRASEASIVVSHGADEGSLVSEGQDIVSLAASDSFIFRAELVQTDLARVHPGQRASVHLSSRAEPLGGRVHDVLPTASATDLTVPVRIDLAPGSAAAMGLFGTARITVGQAADAVVVPEAAVLRDDVNGKEQIALAGPDGKAHWQQVTTGVRSEGLVEVRAPPLATGARAIVSGQVGLPEGAPVEVVP
ncbi:MAG: hypothetical protein NVS2B9_10470 [Myxococcales bacterium]